jgi:hypothetical protein
LLKNGRPRLCGLGLGFNSVARSASKWLVVNPPRKKGAYFHYEGYAPHPIGLGAGKEIGIGLLRAMLRQLGLSPRDLE